MIPLFSTCVILGILTLVCSGESRPTLKFTGFAPVTAAIEESFKIALDNLIDINSIPYDPNKWNDTGLLETAADSRFLRAAPAYGDNPWVHDGTHNTWSAMNLLEANDGRASHVARNTLWACSPSCWASAASPGTRPSNQANEPFQPG